MEKDESIILSKQQIKFFKYFVSQYYKHFTKGEIKEANHCAMAVFLDIENLLQDSILEN